MLEECTTSVLNFEHTILLTEDYIEYLLDEFKYVIIDKEYFDDHSIIYSVQKEKQIKKKDFDFIKLYEQNENLFKRYIDFHISQTNILNEFIGSCPPEEEIFLWGAHITTQFYLAFGMRPEKIKCILDNDRFKWGRRVCGTTWDICSPEILKGSTDPLVILPSSPYSVEIRNQIIKELNANAKIYEIGKGTDKYGK